jgi:DNA (cytosine-5)-methyltransferase 1
MSLRIGSLFAGIGGFDLAARRVGWTTAWYSEIDPFACRVMAKHFPEAKNLGDVRAISYPEPVDVLCGGFPCQDVSLIGKGAGLAGERSGLWREFKRIIKEIRPRFVAIENVAALRTRGLDQVLRDLDALGYWWEWHCIPAHYVGGPHRRDRVWIVARRIKSAAECPECEACGDAWFDDHGMHYGECPCLGPGIVADCISEGLEGHAWDGHVEGLSQPFGSTGPESLRLRIRPPVERWPAEPAVGRVAYGLPARLVRDRLTAYGNAIVPQIAEMIFRAINEAEQ